jgi:hypothetical protein
MDPPTELIVPFSHATSSYRTFSNGTETGPTASAAVGFTTASTRDARDAREAFAIAVDTCSFWIAALETGVMDRRLHPGEETRGEGVAMTRVACIVTSMAGLISLVHRPQRVADSERPDAADVEPKGQIYGPLGNN